MRRRFLLLDARWRDLAIAYCPYIYVDNDAAIMRGLTQGLPPPRRGPLATHWRRSESPLLGR
jgi:hypothetical protein